VRPALALLAAAALALHGCAAIEWLFTPEPPPPPPAPPAAAPAPAPPRAAPSPPAPPAVPASPARPRPAPPATLTPPTPPPPLPPLQPQLSEADGRRLLDDTTRALADAERAAQAVRTEGLQPDERDTYSSIQSFLRQARQALADRDYDRAATLARKAETLAHDLPRARR